VWAIPSYLASAPDFRRYLAYSVLSPNPAFWLPTGSGYRQVIEPLVKTLEHLGVTIVTETEITGVSCADKRVTQIGLRSTRRDADTATWVGAGNERTETVENLLLAVPAGTLSRLVRTPVAPDQQSVVEEAPDIAGIVRLRATQVPIIYLFFKHKLDAIPKEPVGLYGSTLSLAFTDISQTWQDVPAFAGKTVLAVSSSDTSGLPGTTSLADAQAMLQELAEFLPFRPGVKWGESPDIDWEHTKYESNADSQLFINQTGTDAWRPHASSSHISNIYLAGDFCNNDVGMTTIESAVTTGLEAAKVIVRRNRYGDPVKIIPPERNLLYDLGYVWLRYAWAPYVAAASLWSHAQSFAKDGCRKRGRGGLPWLPSPRGGVPGLLWSKRPGSGSGSGSAPASDPGAGEDPEGEGGSGGRRWMS